MGVGVGVGTTGAPAEIVSATVPPTFKCAPPPGAEEITAPLGTLASNSFNATTVFRPTPERVLVASLRFIPTTDGRDTPPAGESTRMMPARIKRRRKTPAIKRFRFTRLEVLRRIAPLWLMGVSSNFPSDLIVGITSSRFTERGCVKFRTLVTKVFPIRTSGRELLRLWVEARSGKSRSSVS